jgi:hypothetical protein
MAACGRKLGEFGQVLRIRKDGVTRGPALDHQHLKEGVNPRVHRLRPSMGVEFVVRHDLLDRMRLRVRRKRAEDERAAHQDDQASADHSQEDPKHPRS